MNSKIFGFAALRKFYELIPLVSMLSFGAAMGVGMSAYALYQKPDVRVFRSSELPPFERVDPEKPQKLVTFRQEYKKIPELEALKKEIGSYKY